MEDKPGRNWNVVIWWIAIPIALMLTAWQLAKFGMLADPLKEHPWLAVGLSGLIGVAIAKCAPALIDFQQRMLVYVARILARLIGYLVRPGSKVAERWGRARNLKAEDAGEWDFERTYDGHVLRSERRARERLAVGVMTREFEKSLTFASLALFLALVLVGGYAIWTRDRSILFVATLTAIFFLLAVARQGVLAWRTATGYFGSSEHEVRELLAFAMRHPTPDDFFDDNGHLLPAFDLRPQGGASAVAVGQPVVDGI